MFLHVDRPFFLILGAIKWQDNASSCIYHNCIMFVYLNLHKNKFTCININYFCRTMATPISQSPAFLLSGTSQCEWSSFISPAPLLLLTLSCLQDSETEQGPCIKHISGL